MPNLSNALCARPTPDLQPQPPPPLPVLLITQKLICFIFLVEKTSRSFIPTQPLNHQYSIVPATENQVG